MVKLKGLMFMKKIIRLGKPMIVYFLQAKDNIRDVERSRGLGNVYKRQLLTPAVGNSDTSAIRRAPLGKGPPGGGGPSGPHFGRGYPLG